MLNIRDYINWIDTNIRASYHDGNFNASVGFGVSFAGRAGFKASAWTRNASEFVKKAAHYISGALSGGVGSLLGRGSFGSGAARGAIVTGLNHLAHLVDKALGNVVDKWQAKQAQQKVYKFFKRLKNHYEGKTGKDFILTKREFNFLTKTIKNYNAINYSTEKLLDNGDYSVIVDFYKTNTDLALSFGRSTLTFTIDIYGHRIFKTFYDVYNFDSKPWGVRSYLSETITRTYNAFVDGEPFKIIYNGNK